MARKPRDRDNYYKPQRTVDSKIVAQIRSVLASLEVDDRVEYQIRTQRNAAVDPVVRNITRDDDGNGVRVEVTLVGPQGGEYYLTDHPLDECPHSESPTGSQGPLIGLRKV